MSSTSLGLFKFLLLVRVRRLNEIAELSTPNLSEQIDDIPIHIAGNVSLPKIFAFIKAYAKPVMDGLVQKRIRPWLSDLDHDELMVRSSSMI